MYGVRGTGEMILVWEDEFFQETSSTATWTITTPIRNVLGCNSGLLLEKLVSGRPKYGTPSKSI